MKKDFKYYLSHVPWILNACALLYCMIMFGVTYNSYPIKTRSVEYVCIDKQIGNSRYGQKTYYLNIKNVETGSITSKNVTLDTFYNNAIGDHLYFTELCDIPEDIWNKAKIYLFISLGLLVTLIFAMNIANWYY